MGLELGLFVLLVVLYRWKLKALGYYRTTMSVRQREWLNLIGREAFHYAERAFTHYDGPAKLNEAVKYVLERSDQQGVEVTYPEIRAVIEKAKAEMVLSK
ncbi:hypothetical protein CIG75_05290 [Tumebacillus algifaecis]|uniref:Phage holin n=2 Tax=Tumebacillus algifaecis TaxID=1214604 RepID=A0A223CYQ3_9BACL|nr:hypothetical protein CIG75_05290 [Tumebacillus algifaecis]